MMLPLAVLFILTAIAFDRTAQIQFTLPKLVALNFCAAGIALWWAWQARRDALKPIPRLVLLPAVVLVGWWIVTLPLAVDLRTAVHGMHGRYNGLISHITMVALFLAIASAAAPRATSRGLMIVFGLALVPVAGYALAQSFGMDPLVWPNARPGSTIGHPVPLATIVGLAIPFVLAFLIGESDTVRRWMWAALLGLFLFVTAATLSRGPQIGVAVAIGIMVLAALKRRVISLKQVATAIAVLLLAAPIALAYDPGPLARFSQRLKQMAELESDPSFTNRFVFYQAAAGMIRDHPIAGVGFESFGLMYPRYRPVEPEQLPADVIPSMVHDGYLHAAATTGIPGLILYVAFVVSLIVLVVRAVAHMTSERDWLTGIAFIGAIAGYLVQDLSGWLEVSSSVYFWTVAGAAVTFCTAAQGSYQWRLSARQRSLMTAVGATAAIVFAAAALDAWRELRADRAFFQSHFLDVNREWPAIEVRVASGLRLVGDDPYYQDAAGVLYLKRFHASGDRDAYDRAAALLDAAAQANRFDPYILIHRVDLDTAALRRKLVTVPSEPAARAIGTLLVMDRNNPSVHEAVANFRAASGDNRAALESIRKAETLRPHHPRYHLTEGDALRSIGDRAGAAAAYRVEATLLTTGDPAWVDVQHRLAVTLLEAGRTG